MGGKGKDPGPSSAPRGFDACWDVLQRLAKRPQLANRNGGLARGLRNFRLVLENEINSALTCSIVKHFQPKAKLGCPHIKSPFKGVDARTCPAVNAVNARTNSPCDRRRIRKRFSKGLCHREFHIVQSKQEGLHPDHRAIHGLLWCTALSGGFLCCYRTTNLVCLDKNGKAIIS